MPCRSKKSAQASLQRKAGNKSFGTVQDTVSNTGSVYNKDSDSSSDDDDDTTALLTLYTNILPEHLKVNQVKQIKNSN